jgi:hypothetical protein
MIQAFQQFQLAKWFKNQLSNCTSYENSNLLTYLHRDIFTCRDRFLNEISTLVKKISKNAYYKQFFDKANTVKDCSTLTTSEYCDLLLIEKEMPQKILIRFPAYVSDDEHFEQLWNNYTQYCADLKKKTDARNFLTSVFVYIDNLPPYANNRSFLLNTLNMTKSGFYAAFFGIGEYIQCNATCSQATKGNITTRNIHCARCNFHMKQCMECEG